MHVMIIRAARNHDFVDLHLISMQKHTETALLSFDYDSVWGSFCRRESAVRPAAAS